MLEDYSTPIGKRYFVKISWVILCREQKLGIGAQAMCIACNDTSVIVINFRKSKTHAITDTYCRPKIYPIFLRSEENDRRMNFLTKTMPKYMQIFCLDNCLPRTGT